MPIIFIFMGLVMSFTVADANKFRGCEVLVFDQNERYVLSQYLDNKERCESQVLSDADGFTYQVEVIK